jgi:ribonucleoside-diphosphate reductase alpha chain
MTARQRLPNRRGCVTFAFACAGIPYLATVSRFPDGRLAEVFLSNGKAGSQSDTNAQDAAIVASIALQHGVRVDVIRGGLLRDSRGTASSPLGVALDLIAGVS